MQNGAHLTKDTKVWFKLVAFLCHFNLLQVMVCEPNPLKMEMEER